MLDWCNFHDSKEQLGVKKNNPCKFTKHCSPEWKIPLYLLTRIGLGAYIAYIWCGAMYYCLDSCTRVNFTYVLLDQHKQEYCSRIALEERVGMVVGQLGVSILWRDCGCG